MKRIRTDVEWFGHLPKLDDAGFVTAFISRIGAVRSQLAENNSRNAFTLTILEAIALVNGTTISWIDIAEKNNDSTDFTIKQVYPNKKSRSSVGLPELTSFENRYLTVSKPVIYNSSSNFLLKNCDLAIVFPSKWNSAESIRIKNWLMAAGLLKADNLNDFEKDIFQAWEKFDQQIRLQGSKSNYTHALYIPVGSESGLYTYSIVIGIKAKKMVSQIVSSLLFVVSYTYARSVEFFAELAQTKTAIGSIMSRNGSHNIGSHVLAALSHNVGTMPDDRVLYQYIQHRMDYIATATTDFPTWRQPLLLVANVMKTFLMQRHLLDYITRSEGLKAYQFQNPSVDTTTNDVLGKRTGLMEKGCQPQTIRIHIRKIADSEKMWDEAHYFCPTGEVLDFIPYPNGEGVSPMKEDVAVAIPGGVIGQHAFYTIIENVLRNAAKHEWGKLGDDEKAKSRLDVFFDFKDNPAKGVVECVVWTDSPFSAKRRYSKPHLLTTSEVRSYLHGERKDDFEELSDYQKLQVKISRSFISEEDGRLRKENWGLAEMRISAGYLNTMDISDIGGLNDDSDARFEMIKPVLVKARNFGEHFCIGYHFDMPKPKEVLVVLPDDALKQESVNKLNKLLLRYGVGIITEATVANESKPGRIASRLAYSFVLVKSFLPKMKTWWIPFRVLAKGDDKDSIWLEPDRNSKVKRCARYDVEAKDDVYRNIGKWFLDIEKGKCDIRVIADTIKKGIYRSWVRHLKGERFDGNRTKKVPLVLDVERDGNGGRDLISDVDLLKVVFESCFDKAASSFVETASNIIDPDVRATLSEIQNMSPRLVPKIESRVGGRKLFVEDMIYNQLLFWCEEMFRDKKDACSEAVLFVLDVLNARKEKKGVVLPAGLAEFVQYLKNSILVQAKVFLSRYEESYVTLPKSLVSDVSSGYKDGKIAVLDNQDVIYANSEDIKIACLREGIAPEVLRLTKEKQDSQRRKQSKKVKEESLVRASDIIAYWRHENFELDRAVDDVVCTPRYLEPLSGAQSYLSSFNCFSELEGVRAARFALQLIETGLMRILIIDERVKHFVEEHVEVATSFRHIGIVAVDHDDKVTKDVFEKSKKHLLHKILIGGLAGEEDIAVSGFDILVIHQGVIDKLLPNHDNPDVVGEFIEDLKKEVRYVVITTGRGSPANIPVDARVVPFSIIESTLFKKYPEKLLLVDAVMNVLPSGRKES